MKNAEFTDYYLVYRNLASCPQNLWISLCITLVQTLEPLYFQLLIQFDVFLYKQNNSLKSICYK